jgi:hypothetical protein
VVRDLAAGKPVLALDEPFAKAAIVLMLDGRPVVVWTLTVDRGRSSERRCSTSSCRSPGLAGTHIALTWFCGVACSFLWRAPS